MVIVNVIAQPILVRTHRARCVISIFNRLSYPFDSRVNIKRKVIKPTTIAKMKIYELERKPDSSVSAGEARRERGREKKNSARH